MQRIERKKPKEPLRFVNQPSGRLVPEGTSRLKPPGGSLSQRGLVVTAFLAFLAFFASKFSVFQTIETRDYVFAKTSLGKRVYSRTAGNTDKKFGCGYKTK